MDTWMDKVMIGWMDGVICGCCGRNESRQSLITTLTESKSYKTETSRLFTNHFSPLFFSQALAGF